MLITFCPRLNELTFAHIHFQNQNQIQNSKIRDDTQGEFLTSLQPFYSSVEPRSPISTALKLAHVPSEQRVFLELDLGVGKLSEVGGTCSDLNM